MYDGTSLHTASCDQSHDSRRRMVQTECVILTQAAAEAGALPRCSAPVGGTKSRRKSAPMDMPHRWSTHGAAGDAGSGGGSMVKTGTLRKSTREDPIRNHDCGDTQATLSDTDTHVHVRTKLTYVSTYVSTLPCSPTHYMTCDMCPTTSTNANISISMQVCA